jgi:prepilin-type N-terminal cleavage/methylation domain-containing protein
MNTSPKSQQSGFTLIEIIMVLMLIGLIGSVGTLGLTTFIKNYTISIQGTDTTSAGQMAILRIAKELVALSAVNNTVTETNSAKIRFTANHGGTDRFFKIELSGTDLNLIEYADNTTTTALSTDLLVDDVASFSLQYYDWISDNNTLSTTPATVWSDKESPATICSTSFSLTSGEFGTIDCDENGHKNRKRIEFDNTFVNYAPPYILYYGGVEYYFCEKNPGTYVASQDATGSDSCAANNWDEKIKDLIPYYDTLFVYPQSHPECYNSFAFVNTPGDECTIGNPVDNPAPVPSNDPVLNGTRLIKVTLLIGESGAPFTINVAPRNI